MQAASCVTKELLSSAELVIGLEGVEPATVCTQLGEACFLGGELVDVGELATHEAVHKCLSVALYALLAVAQCVAEASVLLVEAEELLTEGIHAVAGAKVAELALEAKEVIACAVHLVGAEVVALGIDAAQRGREVGNVAAEGVELAASALTQVADHVGEPSGLTGEV